MAGSVFWAIVLAFGIARLSAATSDWPTLWPSDPLMKGALAARLITRIRRSATAGVMIAASMAGLSSNMWLPVQLLLWIAVGAMVWGAYGFMELDGPVRAAAFRKLSVSAQLAQRLTVVATLISLIRAMFLARGITLLFLAALYGIAISLYALVKEAADEVDGLSANGT
jgi:hypothetical protein